MAVGGTAGSSFMFRRARGVAATSGRRDSGRTSQSWAALLLYRYLSNKASFVVCAVRVKDHHNLPNYSPRLKNTCVRQVVLDKWFRLNYTQFAK